MVIKGSIHPEDITILKVYVPNKREPKYMEKKMMEMKGEIDKF